MLAEKLKEDTKANHQLLEKRLIAKMQAMRSEKDYAGLLILFYSYFGGLELAINQHFDAARLPDYHLRRKTKAIANDLEHLGAALPKLATGSQLPAITNHFESLGALYVIEGSTLGGQIITKMLMQQLHATGTPGFSFFSGYGDDTMRMWQAFKLILDDPFNIPNPGVIIQAANDTFLKFGLWFDGQMQ